MKLEDQPNWASVSHVQRSALYVIAGDYPALAAFSAFTGETSPNKRYATLIGCITVSQLQFRTSR